jgi:hypothetical protein
MSMAMDIVFPGLITKDYFAKPNRAIHFRRDFRQEGGGAASAVARWRA